MSRTDVFSVSASLAARLSRDAVATRFERAWRAEESPRLEEYLGSPPVDGELLAELLAIELQARLKRGEAPRLEDYRDRFGPQRRLIKRIFLENAVPDRLGNFPIRGVLGGGGFGRVFLGHDRRLDQPVAIKVLTRERAEDWEALLHEARMAARLRHAAIVRVYQVAEDEDGDLMLVMEHIDGQSLKTRLQKGPLSAREAVDIALTIADALQHAHEMGITHRDLKPANILLDEHSRALVADFGLAIPEQRQRHERPGIVGTVRYMAPEQAAGETHRVDGRTDLWACGVVLYEMLTGTVPFSGADRREILDAIRTVDPRPPRQREPSIPEELQRIVLRCLEKRMADRYLSAAELIQDLRWWRDSAENPSSVRAAEPAADSATSPPPSDPIVPKGLRSFDESDAAFFCRLLPGPRDRDGVPRSVRQWQTVLESSDPIDAAPVSVLYGPSGSGKSSFVKAGVLPRLSPRVNTVLVEATPEGTEAELRRRIGAAFPKLRSELSLSEAIAALRESPSLRNDTKLVIVVDQFEQWLHAQRSFDQAPLVEALRQCDGAHVQALLLVRDDFWQLLARLMRQLEIRLAEGENCGSLDLFDRAHAEKVLRAFGASFQRFPDDPQAPERQAAERFVRQAIGSLAQNDRVVPVRLALFAEMFKGREWTAAALRAVGGAEGVGVQFLEEMFSARTAPPEYRALEGAVRRALEQLLPPPGIDLKGHRRSSIDLADAAELRDDPRGFARLIAILDHELRLITPTDGPASADSATPESGPLGRWYQLTHDYLVPSIREWVHRKKRETARGRLALRLEERAQAYSRDATRRQLPSALDWLGSLALPPRKPSDEVRQLCRSAHRYYGVRVLALAAAILAVAWIGFESIGRERAKGAANALLTAQPADLPHQVKRATPLGRWLIPILSGTANDPQAPAPRRTRASWALLALADEAPGPTEALMDDLLHADGEGLLARRQLLGSRALSPQWTAQLWKHAEAVPPADSGSQLRAALVLCGLAAPTESERLKRIAPQTVAALLSDAAKNPVNYASWREALRVRFEPFFDALGQVARDREQSFENRHRAITLLADYAADDRDRLVELALSADAGLLPPALAALRHHDARDALERALRSTDRAGDEESRDAAARRQANAAVALLLTSNRPKYWEWLRFDSDPRLQSYLIERLATLLPSSAPLIERLDVESDASIRQALILVLGSLEPGAVGDANAVETRLVELYRTDGDSGVHAAAEWALRKRGLQARLNAIDAELARPAPEPGFDWYVTPSLITMIVFRPAGPIQLGPLGNDKPDRDESVLTVDLGYSFAISSKEMSVRDVRLVFSDYLASDSPDSPPEITSATSFTWFKAARFCRELAIQDQFDEADLCYPHQPLAESIGLTLPDDFSIRCGYRLPLEVEWEIACRAGTITPRCYGHDVAVMDRYAWTRATYDDRQPPLGALFPNRRGLFDMHGGLEEWCAEPQVVGPAYDPSLLDSLHIAKDVAMSLRGGTFMVAPHRVRSANRRHESARAINFTRGFRIARRLPEE